MFAASDVCLDKAGDGGAGAEEGASLHVVVEYCMQRMQVRVP